MPILTELVRRPDMRERLRNGRGSAPVMLVYRGGETGDHAFGDDGRGGQGARVLEQCLDEIGAASGLVISDANVFCSEARTTVVVKLAVPGVPCDIAFYHDTCTDEVSYQILHHEQVEVRLGSRSDLLAAHAEPETLLAEHFGAEAAEAVRGALHALGLTVSAPVDERMEYESWAIPLEAMGPTDQS